MTSGKLYISSFGIHIIAIPSCPGNILTGAGMVADVGMCLAADGVAVHRHFRCGGGDHHAEQGTQAQGQGQK